MAAAVNPDAFSSLAGSPKTQLNIGKSIFYEERINTTGSGLVQVLLVDGSTFTVGPGSDLVIDKFVYNPKKGTGELTASFTKGVMRFVGGKISKNDDAVNIKTPAGSLSIRGCIVMGQITTPSNYGFLLVYGDYMKLKGMTVFQPGNGFFATNGQVVTGLPPKNFTNDVMAGLTNSNPAPSNPSQSSGTLPTTFLNAQADVNNIDQLISDATATQIQDTIAKEIGTNTPTQGETSGETPPTDIPTNNPIENPNGTPGEPNTPPSPVDNPPPPDNNPPPPDKNPPPPDNNPPPPLAEYRGYSAGIVVSNQPQKGFFNIVAATSPDDFVITNDSTGNPVSTKMVLRDVQHFDGATSRYELSFANSESSPLFGSQTSAILQQVPVGNASAVVYDNNGQPYTQTSVVGYIIDGQAAGLTNLFPETFGSPDQQGHPPPLCTNCDFLKWGAAGAVVTFSNNENSLEYIDVINPSWWVAGDVATSLPLQGIASYSGHAVGTVVTNLFAQNLIATNLAATDSSGSTWTTYLAAGDLDMSWNFGSRTGDLTISKFDASHFNDGQGLSFSGAMCAPGVAGCATSAGNHFGGSLAGSIDENFRLAGAANGAFARAPGQPPGAMPAGVMGNWYVSGNGSQGAGYKASGIFAGSNIPNSLNNPNVH